MRKRRSARAGQYESPAYLELQKRLARNVLALREQRGWSQEEAAHRSEMATRLYQRVESAHVNLTLTTLARLCEGFGTDIATLFAVRRIARRMPRSV
jgi:transcriptional regulator with XRE-family HTH domain